MSDDLHVSEGDLKSGITPPIVVGPPGDIELFTTKEALERYLEYYPTIFDRVAFDAEGRRLEVVTGSRFGGITVIPSEKVPTHVDHARRLLIRCWRMRHVKPPVPFSELAMGELFRLSLRFAVG